MKVGGPARAVHGSDGREHVDYDLVTTNAFTVAVRLESLRVFSAGRLVLQLEGTALADRTSSLDGTKPTAMVPVSSVVKTLVDVVLPRSFGRRVPGRSTEQLRYAVPRNAPGRTIIGSTVVRGPTVRVDPRPPIRIASPLYTGNTTGPHLHFGIQDGPDIPTSSSLPFEIGSFTVQGAAALGRKPGTLIITGKRRRVRMSEPLIRSVYKFPS